MLKINIKDKITERVEVGNISEAIRLAEEAAGELNMNMNIVRSRNYMAVFAINVNANKIPLRQSILKE